MTNKQIASFVVISIILLVGVFFASALNYFDDISRVTYVGPEQTIEDEWQIELSQVDPLITPASKLYKALIRDEDALRGDEAAEVVILEFSDFECPYCAQLYPDLVRLLVEYEGEVKLVWKDFPKPAHLQARTAALAAGCAKDQAKFWEYHDYLFENQDILSRELYNQIALELKLDLVEFNSCLDGQKYIQLIGQGLTDGQELGVDATPYLFIGNQRFDYALSYEELERAVKMELGR